MPAEVKIQVCGRCGCGRKGHALSFGAKKCKLVPLTDNERAKVLKELTDEVTRGGDIAEIVEEEVVDDEKESEQELLDKKKKLLLEIKAQLEKQKAESEEVIRKQKEQLQARKEMEELEALVELFSALCRRSTSNYCKFADRN